MGNKLKFIIISALAITTFMLTACQTMNDYALMGVINKI